MTGSEHDCSFVADVLAEDQVSFGDSARESHAADWGGEEAGMGVTPDVVVWPESTGDVSRVLEAASAREVPVTPYAAGTSLEGNAVPKFRGISMDLTRMNAVLAVRPDDFQVDVQPGVMGDRIDEAVEQYGLFFPPMPSSARKSTTTSCERPSRWAGPRPANTVSAWANASTSKSNTGRAQWS